MPNLWVPPLVHKNDVVLMDAPMVDQKLAEHELAKINSVRIWLQALTLADICNPAGTCIEAWERTGSQIIESSLRWPCQEPHDPAALCLWHKFLCITFHPHITTRSRTPVPLQCKLGKWINHDMSYTIIFGMKKPCTITSPIAHSTATNPPIFAFATSIPPSP